MKKQIHEKVLIGKVLEAEAFKNVDPTEQEIDDIYLKNKDSFNIPEKIRASRILILVDDKTSPADKAAKKKAIDKARDRVVHGEDFSKVAMEVSQDRYSAPKGGDIGFFQRGENEPGFDDVAFNTKENAISPVFLTSLGYQFLKVTAIQPAGVVPVADARGLYFVEAARAKNGRTVAGLRQETPRRFRGHLSPGTGRSARANCSRRRPGRTRQRAAFRRSGLLRAACDKRRPVNRALLQLQPHRLRAVTGGKIGERRGGVESSAAARQFQGGARGPLQVGDTHGGVID